MVRVYSDNIWLQNVVLLRRAKSRKAHNTSYFPFLARFTAIRMHGVVFTVSLSFST